MYLNFCKRNNVNVNGYLLMTCDCTKRQLILLSDAFTTKNIIKVRDFKKSKHMLAGTTKDLKCKGKDGITHYCILKLRIYRKSMSTLI